MTLGMAGDGELRDAMIELLGATALELGVITDAVIERGLAPADRAATATAIDRVAQRDPRFSKVSDGLIFVPAVLESTVWTVWVDANDAAEGFVRLNPYLAPLGWWLVEGDVDLVDAESNSLGVLETDGMWLDDRDTDVVFGPPGWLDHLAGGWASVEVVRSALRFTPCATPPRPSAGQAAALRTGFACAARIERAESRADEPTDLRFTSGDGPMLEALVFDPAAFSTEPIAPLPDLHEAAGLEMRGGTVAENGFDWEALTSWQQMNRLRLNHGLTSEQAEVVKLALGALLAHADDPTDGLGSDERERDRAAALIAVLLDDSAVASAFWNECRHREIPPDDITAFATALVDRLAGSTVIGLTWLRARCLDWSGDSRGAAALLDDVVAASCSHRPALLDAAAFASDRGDERRAYQLALRAELLDATDDDDHVASLLDEVEPYALRPTARLVGRNDPCPCGSGRKYKACHLGREELSLADRSPWLYAKAKRFVLTRRPDAVHELADAIAEHAESPELYDELIETPFVVDLALHEGGGFAEFLAARDRLLPADEALLAAQWSLVERGVFEIRRVDGPELVLYDLGRGEGITVVNTNPSARTRVGTVLLGRPLPTGDTYRAMSGFLEVPHTAAASTIDVIDRRNLDELTECLGDWFRPPTVQNTDGDDLEFHTIRWRIPRPRGVDSALRAAGFERDETEPVWRSMRTEPGGSNTVLATLELVADELFAEVNSRRRADDLRDAVAAAIPDGVLVRDFTTTIDDALVEHDAAERPAEDPTARAVLAEFVADYERRWLDEPIPALGGRTPRDAVSDPIGREDVRRLLDSFPEPDAGREGMDPRRLRSALGLEIDQSA